MYEEWKKELLDAKERSSKRSNIRAFKGLHKEQLERASYFSELSGVINKLGLSNPHERSALSIEPTHPVQQEHLDKAFDNLNITPLLRKTHRTSKLSLISLEMLSRYAPDSDAQKIIRSGFNSPLYLLDPLYGFIFLPQNKKLSNHCLAIDIWSAHLKSMPTQLSKELWEKRADNMLSGGALAGRHLFKNLIPKEHDPLKFSTPPVLQAGSEAELIDILKEIRNSANSIPGVEIWLRGQSRDYLTPDRSVLTSKGIAPYSNVRDSDFTPSLYRKYDDFLGSTDKYEDLVLELAEWVHYASETISFNGSSANRIQTAGVAAINPRGLESYQKGLLLQQYGAPSAYLDITSDHTVAAWFATRKCMLNDGKMVYEEHLWNGRPPEEWPTIYIFPLIKGLHPYLDLNSIIADSRATRPERQKCGLLGGAGNLARNYCARYLGMKIRLSPDFKLSNPYDASFLFPSASEDTVLQQLKETNLTNKNRKFILSELA